MDHNDVFYIYTAIQYRKLGNIGLMHLCPLPYCHTLFYPPLFLFLILPFQHAASAATFAILTMVAFDSHTARALLLQLLYLSLQTRAAKNFTERRAHKQ